MLGAVAEPHLEGPKVTSMLPRSASWEGPSSTGRVPPAAWPCSGPLALLLCWACGPVLQGMDRRGGAPFLLAQGSGEAVPGPLPADQLPASIH